MHEYPLVMFGGHLLIRHERQALLLDTGSPVSVGPGTQCRFLGRVFPVQLLYNGLTTEQLSELVGTRIDVLLGADVLAEFAVTIDAETNRVVFGDDRGLTRGSALPLETIGGIPVVDVGLAGRVLRTLFHTGATVSCLPGVDTRPYPVVGVARDFYPGLGEFATELRRVPLTFGARPSASYVECYRRSSRDPCCWLGYTELWGRTSCSHSRWGGRPVSGSCAW